MAENYDVVIIGGGTGGYVAAIRASQLGLKTAIVEKGKLGGTCLHSGCIPSKALLRSAEVYQTAKQGEEYGILLKDICFDFTKIQERKEAIVNKLYQGVQALIKKGKIDLYEGKGRILGPSIFSPRCGTISVELHDNKEHVMLLPNYVVIATGSRPKTIPDLSIDGKYVLSSDEALELKNLPPSITIIGAGAIGIEWASMLADFDVEVTLIEGAERILPMEDHEISKEMEAQLLKKGVTIETGTIVDPLSIKIDGMVSISCMQDGRRKEFTASKLLVSIGRAPNVEDIGLQNTEIQLEDGFIKTNEYYQTKESHIYAIGDVIGGFQLAHVASHEGIVAIEHIAGKNPLLLDYTKISKCIYSNPEVASVGLTEAEARDKGFDIKVGKFPFQANGKALIYGEVDGFVKLIVNKRNDDLLGVHIIGPHATEVISEGSLAKLLDATPWEIANVVHAHPSLAEAIGEAARAIEGKAIHV